MSFRVYCFNCEQQVSPPFYSKGSFAFCDRDCCENFLTKGFNNYIRLLKDVEELTKPLTEHLTLDDIEQCFKEIRVKWIKDQNETTKQTK